MVGCRVLTGASKEKVIAEGVETGDGHLRREELLGLVKSGGTISVKVSSR